MQYGTGYIEVPGIKPSLYFTSGILEGSQVEKYEYEKYRVGETWGGGKLEFSMSTNKKKLFFFGDSFFFGEDKILKIDFSTFESAESIVLAKNHPIN